MKNENLSFSVKVMVTLGKILLLVAFFPYQLVLNRKEGKYSVRSMAVGLTMEHRVTPEGKKRRTFDLRLPGLALPRGFSLVNIWFHKDEENDDET